MRSPVARLSPHAWRRVAGLVICAGAAAVGTFALVRGTSHPAHSVYAGPKGPPPITLAEPLGSGARQVSLSDATSAFGRPIVLPSSGQVTPPNLGAVWLNQLDSTDMTVAVTFPKSGLVVTYSQPALADPLANYQGQVGQTPGSQVIYLKGQVPALAIAPTDGGWGVIAFVANSSNIVVKGPNIDVSSLQQVAESILANATTS
jgi:hypothetical protein